jgi:6-pyruvoyltetrahydropterin/6-carboxytetrahydropterin synthase
VAFGLKTHSTPDPTGIYGFISHRRQCSHAIRKCKSDPEKIPRPFFPVRYNGENPAFQAKIAMHEHYSVRVTKDTLVFSAAHFITFGDNTCERLHGHNYRVLAEIRGPLEANHYVVDFIALRDALAGLVAELDHRMLLPTGHPTIHVAADDREVLVTFEDRRWIFPRGDCVLLPVANTTTELLARYLGERLRDDLTRRTGARPVFVRVEVDENYGQWGICELSEGT